MTNKYTTRKNKQSGLNAAQKLSAQKVDALLDKADDRMKPSYGLSTDIHELKHENLRLRKFIDKTDAAHKKALTKIVNNFTYEYLDEKIKELDASHEIALSTMHSHIRELKDRLNKNWLTRLLTK